MEGIKFEEVVMTFAETYKNRNIMLKEECGNLYLYADEECKFCATGYCLLCNVKRLCEVLENELL
mgnify:FL=1